MQVKLGMITGFGIVALSFMMLMYALERRDRRFILAFGLGCAWSSIYGFLSGAWPFGVVEAIWSVIVVRRFLRTSADAAHPRTREEEFSAP